MVIEIYRKHFELMEVARQLPGGRQVVARWLPGGCQVVAR